MRYQAALRPEPLGSNTPTIRSQPTTARDVFLFIAVIMQLGPSSAMLVDNRIVGLHFTGAGRRGPRLNSLAEANNPNRLQVETATKMNPPGTSPP